MKKIINKFKFITWNIGFIEKTIEQLLEDGADYEITWLRHNYYDRFFADPFILSETDDILWLLVEEYRFIESKGKIIKLMIDKKSKSLLKRELLIETKYHLSYPFLYKNVIIPEQSASGKWISYKLSGEYNEEISDLGIIDGTILNDGTNEWLFAAKIDETKININSKLYRYKIVEGRPDKHSEKLIKDDLRASRPGGNFFYYKGYWYRVAQSSTKEVYGKSISICKILKNDDDEYIEDEIKVISSHSVSLYNKGLHTFNIAKDFIVIDGFEMKFHPIQKVIYKLKRNKG